MIDQNEAVFAWTETSFPIVDQPSITTDQAQQIITHVWAAYRPGDDIPAVRVWNKSYALGLRRMISLPSWGMNKAILLHEIAHSLSFTNDGSVIDDSYTGHGPGFMRIVLKLYADYMGRDLATMTELAHSFGIITQPSTEASLAP